MKGVAQWLRCWKKAGIARNRDTKPDLRLKVSNLTRQTVVAGSIEIADRGPMRRKGLLGRDRLSAEEGLWILPCEAVHTFGMQFSIDLVYLDRKNRVRKIKSNVPPLRFSACLSAHSVIELASGTITRSQTQPGDRLDFSAVESSALHE